MGYPTSIAQRMVERLNADIAETDAKGLPIMYDKTAIIAVVAARNVVHLAQVLRTAPYPVE
ncbi:hypothetical protein [Corynebacterium hylobatis]|uniref:hypothetical protein n=1 Tax=Corynebacterium hylobatis TaxID=1859290 RepID=UPI001F495DBA|nr:hypothetical protein [Corynebacterium hylobatis]